MSNVVKGPGGLAPGEARTLDGLVTYQDGSVVSRTLHRDEAGTLTVFAFDKGQSLSEHTAPFDAFVQVLDGEAEITVGGKPTRARSGDITFMPGGVPHAVAAPARFKMLLIMFKAR